MGIRHPSDATAKRLLAVAQLCHGHHMSADDNYEAIVSIRTKFQNKRPLKPGHATLNFFPKDTGRFTTMYPGRYAECDPPVASKLQEQRINQAMRKDLMPTRDSNKSLKRDRSSSSQEPGDPRMQLLQLVLGGNAPVLPRTRKHQKTAARM